MDAAAAIVVATCDLVARRVVDAEPGVARRAVAVEDEDTGGRDLELVGVVGRDPAEVGDSLGCVAGGRTSAPMLPWYDFDCRVARAYGCS